MKPVFHILKIFWASVESGPFSPKTTKIELDLQTVNFAARLFQVRDAFLFGTVCQLARKLIKEPESTTVFQPDVIRVFLFFSVLISSERQFQE